MPFASIVSVQLWVLGAALGAALLGIIAYFVRRALGLVVEPPPPEENAHH